jgi:hypothetical protein
MFKTGISSPSSYPAYGNFRSIQSNPKKFIKAVIQITKEGNQNAITFFRVVHNFIVWIKVTGLFTG